MKIKIKNKKTTFEKIYVGIAFALPDQSKVYIKTDIIKTIDEKTFNAVNLANGVFRFFEPDEEVIPYNAEVELG